MHSALSDVFNASARRRSRGVPRCCERGCSRNTPRCCECTAPNNAMQPCERSLFRNATHQWHLILFTAGLISAASAPARAATDHLLAGSMGQAFAIDIGSTHADTIGAVTTLEDALWPALAANPCTVQAFGDAHILHNMLQAPANVSGTGQSQGIATFPYGVQGIDVWSATAAVGYRADWWSVFYSGGFVGTHNTQMGLAAFPVAAVGLMGLSYLEAATAPISAFRATDFAAPYYGSAARYMLGAAAHYNHGSLRLAYAGGDPSGIMGSLAYEPWNLTATMVVDAATGLVPFLRMGLVRSTAPGRALLGEDVGKCTDANCVVAPMTSLYARAYALSPPRPGTFSSGMTPQNAAFWTLHGEQLNIPFLVGYLDARIAVAVDPQPLVHDAALSWHTSTFHGGAVIPRDGVPPFDVGITLGYAHMPTLWYANNPGHGAFSWAVDLAWGNWIRGGIRGNAAETFAMYPFATSSTEVFLSLTQEAFIL